MRVYWPTRDPKWRYKRYLKLWGITMLISFVTGWVSGGVDGIVICCLTASIVNAIVFPAWEWEESRRDREYERAGLVRNGWWLLPDD